MKKHTKLIRLIVVTAALVALGVVAFKYMRTYNHIEKGYQNKQVTNQIDEAPIVSKNSVATDEDVQIQKLLENKENKRR